MALWPIGNIECASARIPATSDVEHGSDVKYAHETRRSGEVKWSRDECGELGPPAASN